MKKPRNWPRVPIRTLDQVARTEQYGRLQDFFVEELPIMVIQETPKVSLTPRMSKTGDQFVELGAPE